MTQGLVVDLFAGLVRFWDSKPRWTCPGCGKSKHADTCRDCGTKRPV